MREEQVGAVGAASHWPFASKPQATNVVVTGVRSWAHASVCALVLCVWGCASQVTIPATPATVKTDAGATYSEAIAFVEDARLSLDDRLRQIDRFDAVTKGGVGVGVAGAAAAAAFRANATWVLGLVSLSGLSYTANVATDPHTTASILNAGLGNLDCIAAAGEQGNDAMAGQKYLLGTHQSDIERAVSALQADLAKAEQDPRSKPDAEGNYADEVARAKKSLATGRDVLGKIAAYLQRNPVASEMIRATRRTLYAVNQQIREKSPSIEAVAQSGAILGTFFTTGADIKTSAADGAAKIRQAVAPHANSPIQDALVDDQNRLRAAFLGIDDLLTPVSIARLGQCQTQFAAAAPLTLTTQSPVVLNAGGTVALRVMSGASITPRWSSEIPADVTWNQEVGVLTVTARADAKSKTYQMRLSDFSGHLSDEFSLEVRATAATSTVTKPAVATETSAAAKTSTPVSTPAATGAGTTASRPNPPSGH